MRIDSNVTCERATAIGPVGGDHLQGGDREAPKHNTEGRGRWKRVLETEGVLQTDSARGPAIRGQPSIYFPIGDHVNVSWCCSHTNASGVISTSHIVARHITKLLLSFRQILQFRFWDNPQGRIPPWKVTKTRPFLSMCYGDPSATEVPPCCETATKKLTFSTTSVLLLLNMPLSLSRATILRRQKNPRRVYRPKIAGILFVCNEPEGKYYTVP